ncbi:hypothetical protein MCHI_001657 [Candidatus Magnetoovum chiemensis]|nr:hypothetical protein MCHI_001657 [Candidatus Magnetoovum chiemensis]
MIIHPLRLSKKGGTNLSINGDHKNFNVYGSPASENNPIAASSTFDTDSHACIVEPVSDSGNPDENPSSAITHILRLL